MTVAGLVGATLGALMLIACFREIAFASDNSRMSWFKGGLVAVPYGFILSATGAAENGVFELSDGIPHAVITVVLAFAFLGWAKIRVDVPYERTTRKLPRILAWIWVLLLTVMMAVKLTTGFA